MLLPFVSDVVADDFEERIVQRESAAESAAGPAEQWEVADLAALRVGRVRDFGEVWLGLSRSAPRKAI